VSASYCATRAALIAESLPAHALLSRAALWFSCAGYKVPSFVLSQSLDLINELLQADMHFFALMIRNRQGHLRHGRSAEQNGGRDLYAECPDDLGDDSRCGKGMPAKVEETVVNADRLDG
jgi:hypothetical protein